MDKQQLHGMSVLRIKCQPYKPLWFRLLCITMPKKWRYKFYIDVDGTEYTMVSTEETKDIRIPAGEHSLRIGYMYKNKMTKSVADIGDALQVASVFAGSKNMAVTGLAMSSARTDITDYFQMNFEPEKTYEFKLKMNNLLIVTEDKEQ